MRIHGKGKLNNQILEKLEKGADAIEIHLENELVNNDKPLSEIFDLSYIDECPIYVVHMPLTEDDINIETVLGKQCLERTAELASLIAAKQEHTVLIVAHLATSVHKLKQLGIYEKTLNTVMSVIDKYDNIEIGIENITIFHQDKKSFSFFDTQLMDNIQFVKDCNNSRVGTVLDTCHVLQNEAIMNFLKPFILNPYQSNQKPYYYDIDTFFKENKEYVKLIHLANSNYNGLMENHGTPFLEKDLDILKSIMDCYKKYNYSCPITIEVRENDYNNSVNFQQTLINLKKFL